MFLNRDYIDRAVGLMGAFNVLIVALLVTGALAPAPKKVDSAEPPYAADLTQKADSRCDYAC